MTGSRRDFASNADCVYTAFAIALSCVVIAALVFRAAYFPELGYDEAASVLGLSILSGHFGNYPDPIGPTGYERHYVMDCYPPVYYLVQAGIYRVFGFTIISARAASALFVGLTAFLCYWGGKKIANPATGFAAMALYLVVPLKIYTLVARPDVAAHFFLLAAILALALGNANSAKPWTLGLGGLLYALAVLSHFVALMASPVIAVLVWRQTGMRFWRSRELQAFIAGFFVPLACYAWLLYPHIEPTLRHFAIYSAFGSKGQSPAAIENWWPLRPTLQHIELLRVWFPWVLFGLVPLSVVIAALGWVSPTFRSRITEAGWLMSQAFCALFVFVGTYPNIAVYGYYGPAYLTVGAVAASCTALAMIGRQWIDRAATTAIFAVLATGMTASLAHSAMQTRQLERSTAIMAPLKWSEAFPQLRHTKVLATPHWVFSAAQDQVRASNLLVFKDNLPALPERYQQAVPESGQLSDYGVAILDKYNEFNAVNMLMTFAAGQSGSFITAPNPFARLVTNSYFITGLYHDDAHNSANYVVAERALKTPAADSPWPRMGMSNHAGPEDLFVMPGCVTSIEGEMVPGPQYLASDLTAYSIPLEAVQQGTEVLVAVRVAMMPSARSDWTGFVAYFPTEAAAQAALRDFAAFRTPPMTLDSAIHLLGFPIGDGERGAMMLIRPGPAGGGGRLAIVETAPVPVKRIDIAAALPRTKPCDPALSLGLQAIRRNAGKPPT